MAINETLTGEVCHIKGARPGSARYDPGQTDVERHAYANLVLMCPTHHTVIDDDEEAYTVERLFKIKAVHEAQSAPIPDAEAAAVAEVFIQSVTNIGQSGGLSAHTVNASTITVQSAPSTSPLSDHAFTPRRILGPKISEKRRRIEMNATMVASGTKAVAPVVSSIRDIPLAKNSRVENQPVPLV
jgi:hypothetical protein